MEKRKKIFVLLKDFEHLDSYSYDDDRLFLDTSGNPV